MNFTMLSPYGLTHVKPRVELSYSGNPSSSVTHEHCKDMTKFQPAPRAGDTKPGDCQVCHKAIGNDPKYIARPCGHGPLCYGCVETLKMRPSKPVCRQCEVSASSRRYIQSFEEDTAKPEAEEVAPASSAIPTLLPFSNDPVDSPDKNKHHEYLSGQGMGDVYAMAKPIQKPGRVITRDQEDTADAHLGNVTVTGAAAIVETSEGLFAPGELTNDHDEPEAKMTENDDETKQKEDDPLLPVLQDKSILLEVGLSVELGKAKAIKLFQEGKAFQSAEMLTRCINSFIQAESGNTTLRSVLHSNRALAALTYINGKGESCEELYRLVVEDCDQALHFDHENMKAMYRRAIAFNELEELDRSLEDISRVLAVFSGRDEAHPEAVDLKEKVMEKKRAAEKKWGMTGPMSISRLWNKPSGRPPADEDHARPASIETNELVKMQVAVRNAIEADDEMEAPCKHVHRKRPTAKDKSTTFTPSMLESQLQRLKGKANVLVDFVAHKLTPKALDDAGAIAGGLSSLDPDCTGALLHGLYEAIQQKAIDDSMLMDYVEAMDRTQMVNRMVLLMLNETEKGYVSKLNSHIMTNIHEAKARHIVNEWHKRG